MAPDGTPDPLERDNARSPPEHRLHRGCRKQLYSLIKCYHPSLDDLSACRFPHPKAPLPGHFADQTACLHPRQIALNGGATGSSRRLSHWGGDQGPLRESSSQGKRRAARQLRHDVFCPTRPRFNIVKCSHRRQNCAVHPIQPACQAFGWQTREAQPPCPAHSQRCEDGAAFVAGRDPGRGDGGFDLVAVLSEARQTPEMKAHASPGDWVELGCGCHYIQPSARATFETLSAVFNALGIAAIQEGGQVGHRSGTACQAPNSPSNSCKGIRVILCARKPHRYPERQTIRTHPVPREPAEVRCLYQSEAMPPAFRAAQQSVIQSTQTPSDPCQSSSLNAFCLCPVFDDSSVGRFCPWPGRQIIWFFIEWSRQKPEILFVSFFILLDVNGADCGAQVLRS